MYGQVVNCLQERLILTIYRNKLAMRLLCQKAIKILSHVYHIRTYDFNSF